MLQYAMIAYEMKPQYVYIWELDSENFRLCTLRSTSNDSIIGSPKVDILSKPHCFTKEWMAVTAYNCRK